MPALPSISSRYSTRQTLLGAVSVAMVLGLSAELVTWHSSSAVGVVPILASALVVTTVVAVRRALRRASAQIESILDEELDARPPNGL